MPAIVRWAAGKEKGRLELRHAPETKPNFRLDLESFYRHLLGLHQPLAIDLIRVAAHVYIADTSITRGSDVDVWGSGWHRSMAFTIPVLEPARWADPDVTHALVECLNFLTGDSYEFSFKPWQPGVRQGYLGLFNAGADLIDAKAVCLMSGGIDSCVAAAMLASSGKPPLLVSHRSAERLFSRRVDLVTELRRRTATALPHWSVEITRRGSNAPERTQRSRTFLYAALGAAAALCLGIRDVYLSDNGIASLNMLYAKAAAGSEATRSTHPDFIALFNDFTARLVEGAPQLTNSLLLSTRREVLEALKSSGLQDILALTSSCARTYMTTLAEPHCGTCSQCVDRRFAVESLDLSAYDTKYARDVFTDELPEGYDTTVAEEYVRSAAEILRMSADAFTVAFPLPTRFDESRPIDEQLLGIWELHRRHAQTVVDVLGNKLKQHAAELAAATLPRGCLLRLIPTAKPSRVRAAANALIGVLREALPKAFREAPVNESQVQNSLDAILVGYGGRFRREHPTIRFLGKNFVADFAPQLEELIIELKYPTPTRPATRIREEMAADLSAYRAKGQNVLFVIYDHHRLMLDEAELQEQLDREVGLVAVVAVIR